MDSDPTGLTRYWVEFALPAAPVYEGVALDGDPPLHRALARGVGVTAHDADDAVALIARWLIEWKVIAASAELPPVASIGVDIDVDALGAERLGNPAWRGIWSPSDNLGRPTLLS